MHRRVPQDSTGEFITIDGEKKDGLVKILAEPNLMAISGQEGSFLAGGKVYFPVAQSGRSAAGRRVTLYEQEFGVGLKFTPTVLAGGRINLKVTPEVSELSPEGVDDPVRRRGGRTIAPLITTRRASTTVQLYDGQSFAIGGLIKNNATTDIKAFPVLGEIPIIGALFRSTAFQTDKSELMFVVTPRLVKPMAGTTGCRPTATSSPTGSTSSSAERWKASRPRRRRLRLRRPARPPVRAVRRRAPAASKPNSERSHDQESDEIRCIWRWRSPALVAGCAPLATVDCASNQYYGWIPGQGLPLSPRLDCGFGDAVSMAIARQTLDPDATARNAGKDVAGMDGIAAREAWTATRSPSARPSRRRTR